ncbi:MAG TPA: VWA domain-containing protein [Frankiaceae bacterium]|jgi:hypothetical protein|nr:VWA domain-containing protein [Frankiaceae bacterium]
MKFSATVFQNEYLPQGASDVNAVVTVASEGGPPAATSADKVVVLVVDTSTSMANAKIRAARKAAATAISLLPDGTSFALVAGNHEARLVYPPPGHGIHGPVPADDVTRRDAIETVRGLDAEGGTAISTWLDLTRSLLAPFPNAIRMAYLVTDGNNEGERPELLDQAIARAVGVFQCDTRGVGEQWHVAELRKISSALLGEVDLIKRPEDMDEDFQAFLARAVGKSVADVRLRIWSPKGSTVKFVRQVAPSIEDLTGRATDVNDLTRDYPTGAWGGDESRDYHVAVSVPVGAVGDERLAARVSLMVGDEQISQALVRAVWTDDESLSTRINPQVAHYTGQAELAEAIQEGLEARKQGDLGTATIKLGRAVQLAAASGHDGTVKLLRKVVDIEDAATGTVRVKRDVAALDEMELDTRSTRTVRVSKTPKPKPPAKAGP